MGDAMTELRLLRRDGAPAEGAVVSILRAPVTVPELAMVADARGRVTLPVSAAGHYALSIWLDGASLSVDCELDAGSALTSLQLRV